ncbi:hypothetical protein [Olsenella urininfantis]|uniref:hypothetical protein n=1 Tax=Olsenella urininfantis TaxID=1871033 RepID=UPI0009879D57|nr:hypothetical protein [Olsenella urininfantis]
MADWSRRFSASYRFMRVSRATGMEVGRLGNVRAGGTIERNLDKAYETGSVDFVGQLDLGADLLRVWLDATFADGTTASEPLGTFLVSVPRAERSGGVSRGTADLSGRLREAAEDELEPMAVPTGTNAVSHAAGMLRDAGLEVVADDSDWATSSTWVLGAGAQDERLSTRLGAANALLEAAGFSAARTDPMGRVMLRRHVGVEGRAPSLRMEEGPLARFCDSCTDERDASGVANVVHAVYSTAEETVVGVAVDDDQESPWSTVSRGWRKSASYSFSDLPQGDSAQARQAAADAKARELLASQQSVVHRVTARHVYAPLSVGDAVDVLWPSAGIRGKFAVRRIALTLVGGCPMEMEVRRFER